MITRTRKKKISSSRLPLVFSKSFDNGEVLRPKINRSQAMQYVVQSFITDIPFEEYVVPAAPVSAPVTVQPSTVAPAPAASAPSTAALAPTPAGPNPVPPQSIAPPNAPTSAATDAQKIAILDNLNKPQPAAAPAGAAVAAQPAAASPASAPSQQASFEYLDADPFPGQPVADEDDFVRDMKAIMRGEKVYNSESKTIEKKNQPKVQPAPPTALSQLENKQTIFDQIAESMSYAKAYDLGNIDLEKRFSDFDKLAEIQQKSQPVVTRFSQPQPPKSPTPVGSEEFLTDLDRIAKSPPAPPKKEERRNEQYLYEAPSLAVTQSGDYSYMQNPAVLGGIAVADALQIGLGAISVGQAQVASSAGGFYLAHDNAQRLLTSEARSQMPGSQTSKKTYKQELLWVGELKRGFADASIIIEWEGNSYGEIGTPVISRDLANSTDWTQSSCTINIRRLEKIPQPGTDPRSWPIVFRYEGVFNPAGNGKYEFDGEFEINAFGGLTFTRHRVINRSLIEFVKMGEPHEYVRRGKDTLVPVPEIPQEQLNYLKTKLP